MKLFDRLSATLAHTLDYRLQRANVLSANIANADTPGYTPVELSFDEQLKAFLGGEQPIAATRTHAAHTGDSPVISEATVEFDYFALPDQDGNSVDMDHEMSKLAENQLLYRTTTKAYNKRMALLKYAINEGR